MMAPSRGSSGVRSGGSLLFSQHVNKSGGRLFHSLHKRSLSASASDVASVAPVVYTCTEYSMATQATIYPSSHHGASTSWLSWNVDTTPLDFPEIYAMPADTTMPASHSRSSVAIKREPVDLDKAPQIRRAHRLPTTQRIKRKSGHVGETFQKVCKTSRTSASPSISSARVELLGEHSDDKLGALSEESLHSISSQTGGQAECGEPISPELWSSSTRAGCKVPPGWDLEGCFQDQPQSSIFMFDQTYAFDEMKKLDSFVFAFDDEYAIESSILDTQRESTLNTPPHAKALPQKKFSCAACGYLAVTEKALEDHADFKDHRAFRCTEEPGCTHSCHRRALLDRHIAYHKAPKSYECLYCDDHRYSDAFKRLDAWDQHMKRKHFKEWEKQLIKHCPHADCEYAKSGFRFVSRVQYRSHMANEHGEGKSDCPFGKDGKCKRVGKDGFKRNRDLEEHVKKVHVQTSMVTLTVGEVEDDVLPVYNFA